MINGHVINGHVIHGHVIRVAREMLEILDFLVERELQDHQ